MCARIPGAIFRALAPGVLILAGAAAPAQAASRPATPAKVSSVTAKAAPQAGALSFSWQQSGANTTGYLLETALTTFHPNSSSLPRHGRNHRVFSIDKSLRSFTLSPAQVADAGAGAGSGSHLYFRFAAVNINGSGVTAVWHPKLGAVQPEISTDAPKPVSDVTGGGVLRVASYNVRTARATSDVRNWLARRADVAKEIASRRPDVAALQELGPGRADGKAGSLGGRLRQTTSLVESLRAVGAGNYRLIRETAYVAPGTPHGTQGTRILYNTDTVRLTSKCPEVTGSKNYSPSCSFELPKLAGDSERKRISAAYARLAVNATGQEFWVFSAHLDSRHKLSDKAVEARYDRLRRQQTQAVLNKIAAVNTDQLPVIAAGDWNSYQSLPNDSAHDLMIAAHFTDAAAARIRLNMAYATVNHFDTQRANALGYGARLDKILTTGFTPLSCENLAVPTVALRPSDHNLVFSTLLF